MSKIHNDNNKHNNKSDKTNIPTTKTKIIVKTQNEYYKQ